MKVLIVGGGGREHALAWQLAREGHAVVAAPGNPGIGKLGRCIAIRPTNVDALCEAARAEAVDLVVVGPEAPLVAGLADALREAGVAVFGPGRHAAKLEGSKAYSKQFFERHRIRSAAFAVCRSEAEAHEAIERLGGELVLKLDGLAAGKGVIVCSSTDEARAAVAELESLFGDKAQTLVVERRIRGRELSVMALCDGKRVEILAPAEDHKQLLDGDQGPNTGGMGTVSPASWATSELLDRVRAEIFEPTLAGLAADGLDYRGVLYAGLMVDDDGAPWILEYNCRFGDPETQPVMMRLKGGLGRALRGAADGALPAESLEWDERAAVCVVIASPGYPRGSTPGLPIGGLEALEGNSDQVVFHAGTAREGDRILTAGGRVLGVTALGIDVAAARQAAYHAVEQIELEGKQYRTDIGARAPQET